MPKVKTWREDIIRPEEVKGLIAKTSNPMLKCLIAILYAFGCRISEALELRRKDVRIERDYLAIRFPLKKRRPKSGFKPVIERRLDRNHYLVKYIIDWVSQIEDSDSYIFPSRHKGKHLSRVRAWQLLKEIDEKIWPHAFRHSLATLMAEHGASALEMKAWFGWGSLNTALFYIEMTEAMRTRWSRREF
ncbi:MAG: hypothetical protein DRP27_02550 [Thermotogae bacterium]|nr:MAG: hypothetical protein DRP27_02550 [Thermotogota bacterium]